MKKQKYRTAAVRSIHYLVTIFFPLIQISSFSSNLKSTPNF